MHKRRRNPRIPFGSDNFLSVLEGVEGGFAIFAGIVVGLSFEDVPRNLLILTAGIGIVVNAFNSSAVRYSSEHYLDELDGHEKHRWARSYFVPSIIEFASYIAVSLIALLPLLIIPSINNAMILSVALTLIILFLAGFYRGNLLMLRHAIRDGIEVAGLGALIIVVGGLAGWILSSFVV